MEPLLYLDTARFGRMAPRVQRAISSLNEFASCEGLSCRFDDLLLHGFEAWPTSLQRRYEGLADWRGISEFQSSIRNRVGVSNERPVVLANRTTNLMKVAARLLFQRCRKVLVTDLDWPGYVDILKQERERVGGEIYEVPVRNPVLGGDLSADDLCRIVSNHYRRQRADGLFLSVVSHQGVCLPVTSILRELEESRRPPEFTVLDGAQAIGHVPHDFEFGNCDLLLAGCHKWLRSHIPLGFAVSIRRRSHELVRLAMEQMAQAGDDPLLSFSRRLDGNGDHGFSETVNLMGVFSGRAAFAESAAQSELNQYQALMDNGRSLSHLAEASTWQSLIPHPALRSGILLMRAKDPMIAQMSPQIIRDRFLRNGVALSAYQEGVVRVSLPQSPLSPDETDHFCAALTF
jgi:selenocysteine lyase/cysteine desulfurase